jgi:hypothetical protein
MAKEVCTKPMTEEQMYVKCTRAVCIAVALVALGFIAMVARGCQVVYENEAKVDVARVQAGQYYINGCWVYPAMKPEVAP